MKSRIVVTFAAGMFVFACAVSAKAIGVSATAQIVTASLIGGLGFWLVGSFLVWMGGGAKSLVESYRSQGRHR